MCLSLWLLSLWASTETTETPFQELMARYDRLHLTKSVSVGQIIGLGGYADVYDGTLKVRNTNKIKKVAIKKFRVIFGTGVEEFIQKFERELVIWGNLQHKNVLPLLGIMTMEGFPCLVSEWMENGTMNAYLKAHLDVNVPKLVQGIANGLAFLHGSGVIHSDMKGDNVLIAKDGRAVLSDFGTSRLLKDGITVAGTQTFQGSARWTAPELFIPSDEPLKHSFHTEASDVWAFGMVVYEAVFREVPFNKCSNELQVISSIMGGVLPLRLDGVGVGTDDLEFLWDCCQRCWRHNPASRPSMQEIKESLGGKEIWVEDMRFVQADWSWMSRTGQFLAIASSDGRSISILKTKTMTRCGAEFKIGSELWTLSWSNTEEHIVTLSSDGRLRKWGDIFRSPKLSAQSVQGHDMASVELSTDDRFIVSTNDSTAKLWDASNLSLVWRYWGCFWSAAFHPLGNRVIFYWPDDVLDVNIKDLGNITATQHKLDFSVYGITFDSSGDTCIANTDQGVVFLNGDTFKVKTALPHRNCMAMQITPNGKYILLVLMSKKVISWSETVVLWDIAVGRAVEVFSLPVSSVSEHPHSVNERSAEISKSCRNILLQSRNHSTWTTRIFHLTSTYY